MAMAAVHHPAASLRSRGGGGGGGGGGAGGGASPTVVKKKLLQNGWQEALITEYFQNGSDAAGIYIPNLLNGWLDQEQEQEELLNDRTLSNPVMIPPPSPSPNASPSPNLKLTHKPSYKSFSERTTTTPTPPPTTTTTPMNRAPTNTPITRAPTNTPITPAAQPEARKGRVCVLSLDGGGIRGVISAKILVHLERLLQEKSGDPSVRVVDFFDCVAGTNVGALIGAMLFTESPDTPSRPLFSAHEALRFLCDNGPAMYKRITPPPSSPPPPPPLPPPTRRPQKKNFLRKLFACGGAAPGPEPAGAPIHNMFDTTAEAESKPADPSSPLLNVESLQTVLRRAVGTRTLRDAMKPVLLASYDISLCAPLVFSRGSAVSSPQWNFELYDVLRAGMATPGLFPPATVTAADGSQRTAVDAGMVLNCPAVNAVAHVCWNVWEFPVVAESSDVLVLSLGTGVCEKRSLGCKEWGASQWSRPMAEIAVENVSNMADQMLGMGYAIGMAPGSRENYLRIQATLPTTFDMDDARTSSIRHLERIADDCLNQLAIQHTGLGGPKPHSETYAQRLDWFADQLIQERQARKNIRPAASFMGKKA